MQYGVCYEYASTVGLAKIEQRLTTTALEAATSLQRFI
jgi:hypothetical protein